MPVTQDQNNFYSEYYHRHKTATPSPAFKDKAIVRHLAQRQPAYNNIMDIGCLNSSLKDFLLSNLNIGRYVGIDLIPPGEVPWNSPRTTYIQADIDREFPAVDVKFDAIICSEVIEHIVAPDTIFLGARNCLEDEGVLVITTPNLAVWYNRLLLAFGYQPCFTEVSVRYNDVGKLKTDSQSVGGHLRLFTLKALVDLARKYDFIPVTISAENDTVDLLARITHCLGRLNPSLGRTLVCVFKKASSSRP